MDQDRERKLNQLKKWLEIKTLSHDEKVKAKNFFEGQPVVDILPGEIRLAGNSKEARNAAKKEAVGRARANGRQVIETPEADIVIEPSGVKKSLEHTINQEKLDALPYIPEGIKKGITIDISDDFDGKPIRNIHKALPVKTDSGKDLLMIRSRQGKGQEPNYYNHLLFKLNELKKESDPRLPPVANPGYKPDSQEAGNKGIAYVKNILQDILNVKENEQ